VLLGAHHILHVSRIRVKYWELKLLCVFVCVCVCVCVCVWSDVYSNYIVSFNQEYEMVLRLCGTIHSYFILPYIFSQKQIINRNYKVFNIVGRLLHI
jgi:hypothetical protein